MKTTSIPQNILLICSVAFLTTSCDDIGESVSSLGSLCIIAFGVIVAYIVHKAFHDAEPEGHDTCLGTLAGLGVLAGAFALSVMLPEDIRLSIGIIALIIGLLLLVFRNKKK